MATNRENRNTKENEDTMNKQISQVFGQKPSIPISQ